MPERETPPYEELDPYQLEPGEKPTPHFYWDEKRGKMMVRYYVVRNGESRLLPGSPEEATSQQIGEFYRNKNQGNVIKFGKRAKPSEGTGDEDSKLPKAA